MISSPSPSPKRRRRMKEDEVNDTDRKVIKSFLGGVYLILPFLLLQGEGGTINRKL